MPRHGAGEWYSHAGHLCEQILTQEFCNGAGARVSVVHMFSVSWEEIHCSALPAKFTFQNSFCPSEMNIGVRAGGARGAAAPPNFGQLRFFGQQEKIWAKLFFKDVSVFFY